MGFDLNADFEADVKEAMLSEVERSLTEADRAEQIVREATRDALTAAGYGAEGILAAMEGPEVRREDGRVTVSWTIDHPGALPLEVGSSDHTVRGDSVLAIPVENLSEEHAAEIEGDTAFYARVEVSGVDETRHTRQALAALRRALQGRR
jgi:hypothetical protein